MKQLCPFINHRVAVAGCLILGSFAVEAAPVGTTTGDTVVVNGRNVDVDFNEFLAGTFVDTEYQTSGPDAGGLLVGVPLGFGFELVYTGNGGNVDAGVLYDTDRRQYDDGDGNPLDAPVYDNFSSIIPNSEGGGMVGEDPDLEFDSPQTSTGATGTFNTNANGPGGTTSWAGGNLSGGPGTSAGSREGNAIILQENATTSEIAAGHLTLIQGNGDDNNSAGSLNAPDDGGEGTIRLNFETAIVAIDFEWIDFEEGGFEITFVDGTATASIEFSEFTGDTTNLPANPGGTGDWVAVFGGLDASQDDGYSNQIAVNSNGNMILTADRINAITNTATSSAWSDGQNHNSWDAVFFTLTGSGGLGAVGYTVIPEPSTYMAGLICILMAGGLYLRRRINDRRKRS